MKYFQVKDWNKFQHYKERNPPWIKLETDVFMKYEFGSLSDASKLLAVCIWTLASRSRDPKLGLVPADLEYIKRQCNLGDLIKIEHLKELVNQGYIIDASNALADCKQIAIPETYSKEAYSKEGEAKSFAIEESRLQEILKQFDIFWQDFPTNGRNKGSKKDAEAKFKIALKKSTFNEIMQGVSNYAMYIATSGQSNQDAFRWLEKERWTDDYTISNKSESPEQRKSREYAEAAVRGMLRAENPDF